MDITNLFKATVKTVRIKQKAHGLLGDGGKNDILSRPRTKGEFAVKAKNVVATITKLRDFLLEHRKEYINASSHLSNGHRMSDAERDQIDDTAQTFIKSCTETIKAFKNEAHKEKISPQVKEFRECVLILLEDYLKIVCKIYSEQRAVRVKRVVDKKRIQRLEPERKRRKSSSDSDLLGKKEDTEEKDSRPKSTPYLSENVEEDELTPEEMQMFEQENKHLFEEMNSMVDEVRQIEGKVVEISRLQEIFTEKVLEQQEDIDRIADTVVGTTENIKDANEEIREAMKNNAGFRVWILFFLVVCSFSLLFLDWYNA